MNEENNKTKIVTYMFKCNDKMKKICACIRKWNK